ncbi:MAG: hydantoinase B/oxoprolinase family protein, partial [Proteobacteria bacterium]|nr:hydantoinase B/oxoprolinase family protein [Pseudomonadota bacterium]
QTVVDFIRQNVRVPDLTMGDVWGEVSACRMLGGRLLALLDESGIDIADLGADIQDRSDAAMRAAIRAIPDGEYRSRIENDVGFEEPLVVACRVTIRGDTLAVDYTGTTRQLPRSVNSVPNYTFAYSCFGIKAILSPDLPNNEGAYRAVSVWAPEGTILNPRYPAACTTRAMVGQLLPPAIMAALAPVLPERVLAAPGSPGSSFMLSGMHRNRPFATISFVGAGMGAGPDHDGLSPISFPSNVSNTPIEVMEALVPIRILERRRRGGAGGAGRRRGGDGQRIEFAFVGDSPAVATILMSRMKCPAPGILGGGPGAVGRLFFNGRPRNPTEHWVLQPGDRVTMETSAGGGYGDPRQ